MRVPADEVAFDTANSIAMGQMMQGMSVHLSASADAELVAMMMPHHHGAIDMAQAELRYGHNETLRRIPQEIVVEQQQEIVAMRLAHAPAGIGRRYLAILAGGQIGAGDPVQLQSE